MSRYYYRYRDCETGYWCSEAYALANPKTTVRERFPRKHGTH